MAFGWAMRVEVVAIGDEVLSGRTVNGNGAYLARQLALAGFPVTAQRVLADEGEALKRGLSEALEQNDLVICTGGLGPTLDDCTRLAVLELVGGKNRFDERVAADLRRRYGDQLISLNDQATIPDRAEPFLNPVGTAPGLFFDLGEKVVVLLPGVPIEMEALFQEQLLPALQRRFPASQRSYFESVQLLLTPESAVDPLLRELQQSYPDLSFGIYPDQAFVSVRIGAKEAAHAKIAPARKKIEAAFADRLFQGATLEEAVHEWMVATGSTLATAESCTGGAIAARLTRLAGASNYFLGSVVAYSNPAKESLLGVSRATLDRFGAVSGETVVEMVKGVLDRFGAQYGIAVSGIAGPSGGSPEKPVGTVWLAIAERGGICQTERLQLRGGRDAVIYRTVNQALARLLLRLLHGAH